MGLKAGLTEQFGHVALVLEKGTVVPSGCSFGNLKNDRYSVGITTQASIWKMIFSIITESKEIMTDEETVTIAVLDCDI